MEVDVDFLVPNHADHFCFCPQFQKYLKTFGGCMEWKKKCGFCKYTKNKKFIIESVPLHFYFQYKQFFTLDELLSSKKTIKKLFEKDGKNIPFADLILFFQHYQDLGFHQEILFLISTPIHSDTRILLKYLILNLRIHQTTILPKIIHFILNLLDDECKKDQDMMNILCSFCLQLQFYDHVLDLIQNMDSFTIHNFYDLQYLPQSVLHQMIPKISNIFEILALERRKNEYVSKTVPLYIDLHHMIESIHHVDPNDLQVWNNKISVIYYDFLSQKIKDGIDASGLTKDFYSHFHTFLKSQMVEKDGYLIIPRNCNHADRFWTCMGILFARSILNQNISPQFPMHPILIYFLSSFHEEFRWKHFFEILSPFEIEFLKNTQKIVKMSMQEYTEFLSLMDEEPISKKMYLQKIMKEHYFYPNTFYFVHGFQKVYQSRNFPIQFLQFQKFIHSHIEYNLNQNDIHSLKTNLRTTDSFQKVFLEVLEYLYYNHFDKFEKFIKYWFGCIVYSFSNVTPRPSIRLNKKCSNYFMSHTCFNELEYNTNILDKQKIRNAIECTLLNQEICQKAGFSFQNY